MKHIAGVFRQQQNNNYHNLGMPKQEKGLKDKTVNIKYSSILGVCSLSWKQYHWTIVVRPVCKRVHTICNAVCVILDQGKKQRRKHIIVF